MAQYRRLLGHKIILKIDNKRKRTTFILPLQYELCLRGIRSLRWMGAGFGLYKNC